MKPVISLLIPILYFFFFTENYVFACSCNCFQLDVPLQDIGLNLVEFKSPKIKTIFLGKFVDYRRFGSDYILTFEVEKYYKGKAKSTIEIRTSAGDCGFKTKKGNTCLIFAYEGKQDRVLYTSSSECCRSVSKEDEPPKYRQYQQFLNVVTQKINGKHTFTRFKDGQHSCKQVAKKTVDPVFLTFTIENNEFHGDWMLYDVNGEILEKGVYKNGKRDGMWTVAFDQQINRYNYKMGEVIASREEKKVYAYIKKAPYTYLKEKQIILNKKTKIIETYSVKGKLLKSERMEAE